MHFMKKQDILQYHKFSLNSEVLMHWGNKYQLYLSNRRVGNRFTEVGCLENTSTSYT
jgi:hypothetical protein